LVFPFQGHRIGEASGHGLPIPEGGATFGLTIPEGGLSEIPEGGAAAGNLSGGGRGEYRRGEAEAEYDTEGEEEQEEASLMAHPFFAGVGVRYR